MRNFNILVEGQIGSGKTQFAKRLLARTPRAVVLDHKNEYDDGAIFYDWMESAEFFREHLHDDFHIIFRSREEAENLAWMEMLFKAQESMDLPPVGLFLEESSKYSTTHDVPRIVEEVYTLGREPRINVVTVAQTGTQVNREIRGQHHIMVTFRQYAPSSTSTEALRREDIDALPSLETLTPDIEPVYGTHYLTSMGDFPVMETWAKHVRAD